MNVEVSESAAQTFAFVPAYKITQSSEHVVLKVNNIIAIISILNIPSNCLVHLFIILRVEWFQR